MINIIKVKAKIRSIKAIKSHFPHLLNRELELLFTEGKVCISGKPLKKGNFAQAQQLIQVDLSNNQNHQITNGHQ